MLATVSAAVGQSVNVTIKRGGLRPLLYLILKVRSGKTKSPTIRTVVTHSTEIDRRLRQASLKARQEWEAVKKAHDRDPKMMTSDSRVMSFTMKRALGRFFAGAGLFLGSLSCAFFTASHSWRAFSDA